MVKAALWEGKSDESNDVAKTIKKVTPSTTDVQKKTSDNGSKVSNIVKLVDADWPNLLSFGTSQPNKTGTGAFVNVDCKGSRMALSMCGMPQRMRLPFEPSRYEQNLEKDLSFQLEMTDEQTNKMQLFESVVKKMGIDRKKELFPRKKAGDDPIFKSYVINNAERNFPSCLRVHISDKNPPRLTLASEVTPGRFKKLGAGSVDDLRKGSFIVPTIMTNGGVWVNSSTGYGLKLYLKEALVLPAPIDESTIDMGDCTFVEEEAVCDTEEVLYDTFS